MRFQIPIVRIFVLPAGATSGARIVLNGDTDEIDMYDSANELTGRWSATDQTFTIYKGNDNTAYVQMSGKTSFGYPSFIISPGGNNNPGYFYAVYNQAEMDLVSPFGLSSGGVTSSIQLKGQTIPTGPTEIDINATDINLNGLNKFGNIACGEVAITITAINTPTSAVVNFGPLPGTTFTGIATAQTTNPGTQVTGVGVSGVGSSSMTVWVTRTTTGITNVYWMVIGQ